MVTGPGTENWTPLEAIHPTLIQAVLAHEDATFWRHRGFAPFAIETALRRNLEAGRFAFGGSTISMQLAKNLFLSRNKTLARKAREVVWTWWLERTLTKEQILELYLNVVELAPERYGVAAAAEHYFGREPRDLSPAEATFLAVSLPSPSRSDRQRERGRIDDGTREQMRFLLDRMAARGAIDDTARVDGLAALRNERFFEERALEVSERPWWEGLVAGAVLVSDRERPF
jgi:membrane peptidoglycan carboxypeptidase